MVQVQFGDQLRCFVVQSYPIGLIKRAEVVILAKIQANGLEILNSGYMVDSFKIKWGGV